MCWTKASSSSEETERHRILMRRLTKNNCITSRSYMLIAQKIWNHHKHRRWWRVFDKNRTQRGFSRDFVALHVIFMQRMMKRLLLRMTKMYSCVMDASLSFQLLQWINCIFPSPPLGRRDNSAEWCCRPTGTMHLWLVNLLWTAKTALLLDDIFHSSLYGGAV